MIVVYSTIFVELVVNYLQLRIKPRSDSDECKYVYWHCFDCFDNKSITLHIVWLFCIPIFIIVTWPTKRFGRKRMTAAWAWAVGVAFWKGNFMKNRKYLPNDPKWTWSIKDQKYAKYIRLQERLLRQRKTPPPHKFSLVLCNLLLPAVICVTCRPRTI